MSNGVAYGVVAILLAVSACGTPEALEKPPNAPTMAHPADINPLPAIAQPDADAGSHPECNPSDALQCR